MRGLTKMSRKSYERFFSESIWKSVHFWLLSGLLLLTLANAALLLRHWATMTLHLRLTVAALLLWLPQPWVLTIREHRLLQRTGAAVPDELKRKLAIIHLPSTVAAYAALLVSIETLKLAIR